MIETDYDFYGNIDSVTAFGVVELNLMGGLGSHVKWICRVTGAGSFHESDRSDLSMHDPLLLIHPSLEKIYVLGLPGGLQES